MADIEIKTPCRETFQVPEEWRIKFKRNINKGKPLFDVCPVKLILSGKGSATATTCKCDHVVIVGDFATEHNVSND